MLVSMEVTVWAAGGPGEFSSASGARAATYTSCMDAQPAQLQRNAWLALVAFVALSAGVLFAVLNKPGSPAIEGLLWPDPPRIPPFSLQSAQGGTLGQADLQGRWTLLFFGFTHCPDVCPTTLATLKRASVGLQDFKPFAGQGQVLFVSLDPERDSLEKLAAYVGYFDPRFRAATGDEAALDALTRPLGVIRAKVPDASGEYTLDHTASIFLIDPSLRVVGLLGLPHDATKIAATVKAITAFATEHP